MMALRLKNDGFGPNTTMYETLTLREVLELYTGSCKLYDEGPLTIARWMKIWLLREEIFLDSFGVSREEKAKVLAAIADRCAIIMQTPDGTLERDWEEAAEAAGMVPAPAECYWVEE
jgi:hypothetical protein